MKVIKQHWQILVYLLSLATFVGITIANVDAHGDQLEEVKTRVSKVEDIRVTVERIDERTLSMDRRLERLERRQ